MENNEQKIPDETEVTDTTEEQIVDMDDLNSKDQNTIIFGLINMPRWPRLNMFILMLMGAGIFIAQLFHHYPAALIKSGSSENPVSIDMSIISLWPTMLCAWIVYFIYRTLGLRSMVKHIKKTSLEIGFGMSTKDAEDVASLMRASWLGIVLNVFTLLLVFLTQALVIMWAIKLFLILS